MRQIRVGSARPDFRIISKNEKGVINNLTGATAQGRIRKIPDDGETVSSDFLTRAGTPTDIPNGEFTHFGLNADFSAGDEGFYNFKFTYTLADGDITHSDLLPFEVVAEAL